MNTPLISTHLTPAWMSTERLHDVKVEFSVGDELYEEDMNVIAENTEPDIEDAVLCKLYDTYGSHKDIEITYLNIID